jgi:zinc transport system substrate-binding protein
MKIRWWASVGIAVVCFALGSALSGTAGENRVKAFVSIMPQAYFVERVGSPHVEVGVMAGAGQDIHTYDPTPRTMSELAKAKIYFRIGMPFENAIVKKIGSTFKTMEIIDTTKGVQKRRFKEEEVEAGHSHSRKHGSKHAHHDDISNELDPHAWLDPKQVKIQVANIAEGLIRVDPAHSADYQKNLKDFQSELDALDSQLSSALAPLKGKPFYVYHPAYGYFADAYGLKQIAVELGGKEPSSRHLAELIKKAKSDGAQVIFVQPQFSKKSAEALAKAIGGVVIPLDDLSKDYMGNMKDIAKKISDALSKNSK